MIGHPEPHQRSKVWSKTWISVSSRGQMDSQSRIKPKNSTTRISIPSWPPFSKQRIPAARNQYNLSLRSRPVFQPGILQLLSKAEVKMTPIRSVSGRGLLCESDSPAHRSRYRWSHSNDGSTVQILRFYVLIFGLDSLNAQAFRYIDRHYVGIFFHNRTAS